MRSESAAAGRAGERGDRFNTVMAEWLPDYPSDWSQLAVSLSQHDKVVKMLAMARGGTQSRARYCRVSLLSLFLFESIVWAR